ncbi:hypothetical protein An02g03910 [Aspergillus niger]|uniref:Uncharacterized protein n=2 Tax=Aspergillus niger TaxID=5061 RepID=A2QCK7_ASPNC|nr:hypothetical protein An02g03910 [Aspergillus niger]CAL00605.1 hypothetical protein An02g03910 [Aspergillus niger]
MDSMSLVSSFLYPPRPRARRGAPLLSVSFFPLPFSFFPAIFPVLPTLHNIMRIHSLVAASAAAFTLSFFVGR